MKPRNVSSPTVRTFLNVVTGAVGVVLIGLGVGQSGLDHPGIAVTGVMLLVLAILQGIILDSERYD